MISPLTLTRSVRDPEWLTLEVCREFVRNKCARSEDDCKYAHPPPQVEVQNGKVICCYDSLQSRCFRHDPPCKYFHPPPHLRDQITQTRRPHLLSPNYQSFPTALGVPSVVSGLVPFAIQNNSPYAFGAAHSPAGVGAAGTGSLNNYKQLLESLMSTTSNLNAPQQTWVVPSIQFATPRQTRSDRLEVCREFQRGVCCRPPSECKYAHPPPGVSLDADNHVTVCIDYLKDRCTRESCRYFHPPMHLQSQLKSSAMGGQSSFLQLQQQQNQQQQQQHQQQQQQQRAASISLLSPSFQTNPGGLYGATNINNTNNNSLVAAWPIIQNVHQQPSLTLSQYQQLAAILSLQQQQHQQQQQQQHMQQLLQQNVQQLQLQQQQQQLLLGGNGSLVATTTSTSNEVFRP